MRFAQALVYGGGLVQRAEHLADQATEIACLLRRDILQRVESGQYPTRHELLRDLALNLMWVNRYAITMFVKRPTRWRDAPRARREREGESGPVSLGPAEGAVVHLERPLGHPGD